jgi:FKBP-type peptidyl-prolyl cis-trans isomerase SlyD
MKFFRSSAWVLCVILLPVSLGAACAHAESKKGAPKMTVAAGKQVSLEYTLKLSEKDVLESNVGKEPLTYTQGQGQIIPGLEKALEGMTVGESRHVTVQPADAYGQVNPEAMREVKKELIPPDAQKVGAQLQAKGQDGRMRYPRVTEVKQDTVVLDFNHPLAGKTLHFDVKVLDIKVGEAPKEK